MADSDVDSTYIPDERDADSYNGDMDSHVDSNMDQNTDNEHDHESESDNDAAAADVLVTRRLRTSSWRTAQQKMKRACRGLCPLSCRMGCRSKFSLARLHDIWEHFYSLSFDSRRQWVYSFVSRKTRTNNQRPHYIYHLPDEQNNRIPVCSKIFNRTIGYSDRSCLVRHMMANTQVGALVPDDDKRGRAKDPKAIDRCCKATYTFLSRRYIALPTSSCS